MMEISKIVELQGNVVLRPIYNPLKPNKKAFTNEEIQVLDKMHRERIQLSDTILVVNVDGYIGNNPNFNHIEFDVFRNKVALKIIIAIILYWF